MTRRLATVLGYLIPFAILLFGVARVVTAR
jgi:hypothetical protein